MSNPKRFPIVKSKTFVTDVVTAVFPYLHEESKFGGYEVNADMLAEPELHAQLKEQARVVWNQAAEEFGFDASQPPANALFREGETKDGETFVRARFKMKSTRKVKGNEVPVSPTIVDAQNNPCTEAIYGGSKVQIAYFVQYAQVNGNHYLSLKLTAVRVIELCSATGERSAGDIFGAGVDGFQSSGEAPAPTTSEAPAGEPAGYDW